MDLKLKVFKEYIENKCRENFIEITDIEQHRGIEEYILIRLKKGEKYLGIKYDFRDIICDYNIDELVYDFNIKIEEFIKEEL